MLKCRMLYEKTGSAKYISHLDLMRVFRRAFMRAGVEIAFSQGFNPHPTMSVPLPLPTGFSSRCDLLDFDTESLPDDFIARMTAALPQGIVPHYVYQRFRKPGDIAAARYTITLHGTGYDPVAVKALFSSPVIMLKRTKRGETEVDICTFIKSMDVTLLADGRLILDTVLAAGNETLNPEYLVKAIEEHTDSQTAWAEYLRTEILDGKNESFG